MSIDTIDIANRYKTPRLNLFKMSFVTKIKASNEFEACLNNHHF